MGPRADLGGGTTQRSPPPIINDPGQYGNPTDFKDSLGKAKH
jgi:hypothetical protein